MMQATSGSGPEILSQTPRWIVVNKPAGWLTIPGRGHPGVPVLIDWVRKVDPGALVVHRLDLETSGVILFARSPDAHREANRWFSAHQTVKLYDCLATGSPLAPMLRVREPIEGQPASSQIEVRERLTGCFLARVRPLSGKRHQIRIHLAQQGHPLLGDPSYGGPRTVPLAGGMLSIPRVALHAARLELPGGESFEAPWPVDFSGWVEQLRGTKSGSKTS